MPLKAAIVPVTPFQQNCTLLWDEASKRGAVVDPGGDLARIVAGIAKTGMVPEKILLTHGHLDHAGGAAELKEKLAGIPIEGPHLADKFLLDELAAQGLGMGIVGMRNVTPDRWLAEGDTVTVAGATFSVLHCPGHSPGSVVFINAPQRFALVGDVLFQGSIGRTDFPYGDHDALIEAIKTKLLPLGDDMAFICGHGPMSTFGEERQSNPFIVG
jgi:hydroxyacylglutathione hydrolase